jgi:GTP pyrophosphokinase
MSGALSSATSWTDAVSAERELSGPEGFRDALRELYSPADARLALEAERLAGGPAGTGAGRQAARDLLRAEAEACHVTAALLVTACRRGGLSARQILEQFGPILARRVETVRRRPPLDRGTGPDGGLELRHWLREVSRDPEQIVLLAAVRAAELAAAPDQAPHQYELARETFDVVVPLARRAGLQAQARHMEDLCFPLVEAEAYHAFLGRLRKQQRQEAAASAQVIESVRRLLLRHRLSPRVMARPVGFYQRYVNFLKRGKPTHSRRRPLGVQIIVPSVRECYVVLGLLHTVWRPVPGRCVDYVRVPRTDGYQALHSTVAPTAGVGQAVQFQIFTPAMYREAEGGLAVAWLRSGGTASADRLEGCRRWFHELEWEAEQVEGYAEVVALLARASSRRHVSSTRPSLLGGALAPAALGKKERDQLRCRPAFR